MEKRMNIGNVFPNFSVLIQWRLYEKQVFKIYSISMSSGLKKKITYLPDHCCWAEQACGRTALQLFCKVCASAHGNSAFIPLEYATLQYSTGLRKWDLDKPVPWQQRRHSEHPAQVCMWVLRLSTCLRFCPQALGVNWAPAVHTGAPDCVVSSWLQSNLVLVVVGICG